MRKYTNRWIALGTLAVMAFTTLIAGMAPVQASAKTKKYLMYGAGALTAYGLLKKKKTLAIAGAVGTALAYKSYRSAKKKEDAQRARYGRYRIR